MLRNPVHSEGFRPGFGPLESCARGALADIGMPDIRPLSFDEFKTVVRGAVDEVLKNLFSASSDNEVVRVAHYASVGAGHRWRVMTAIAAGQIFSPSALQLCLPFGVGIELAHCASIILDDLPSMDDGRFRRGKPCPHHVFARWAVELAPMLMVLKAYRLGLANGLVPVERRIATAIDIAVAGQEMIAGQGIDVTHSLSESDPERMFECYRGKSGALYAAAAKAGALSAGSTEAEAALLFDAGMRIGLSYQFLDDVADVTGTLDATGKLPNQDVGKPNAIHFYGADGARKMGTQYRDQAIEILSRFGPNARRLSEIAQGATWAPV